MHFFIPPIIVLLVIAILAEKGILRNEPWTVGALVSFILFLALGLIFGPVIGTALWFVILVVIAVVSEYPAAAFVILIIVGVVGALSDLPARKAPSGPKPVPAASTPYPAESPRAIAAKSTRPECRDEKTPDNALWVCDYSKLSVRSAAASSRRLTGTVTENMGLYVEQSSSAAQDGYFLAGETVRLDTGRCVTNAYPNGERFVWCEIEPRKWLSAHSVTVNNTLLACVVDPLATGCKRMET